MLLPLILKDLKLFTAQQEVAKILAAGGKK